MKKGFTLIELLAVIAILAIILLIVVPYVLDTINNAKNSAYTSAEQTMEKAATNYLAANPNNLPNEIGDIVIINLADLKTTNFITDIIDPKDNTSCTGQIIIRKKTDIEYSYTPYLDCGTSDYQTNSYATDGLVLHLDGYDAPVSGYWEDKSIIGADAHMLNMAGTPNSGYDPNKKAYVLDGNNDYFRIENNSVYTTDAANQFSYSIWFKGNDYNTRQDLLTRTFACNNPGNFDLFVYLNKARFSFYSNLDAIQGMHFSTDSLTNGSIYNIVWTRTWGQTGTKLYINGVLSSASGDNSYRGTTYADPIFIGARNGDTVTCQTDPYPSFFFSGNIYDIKIYNRILTDSEVITNYNYDKAKLGL